MKKVGLFLLAVLMVAEFSGCGGGGDDDAITVGVTADNCIEGVATGTITNANTGDVTGPISVNPGTTALVELPEEGTYRFQFHANTRSWDFVREMKDTWGVNLICSD